MFDLRVNTKICSVLRMERTGALFASCSTNTTIIERQRGPLQFSLVVHDHPSNSVLLVNVNVLNILLHPARFAGFH